MCLCFYCNYLKKLALVLLKNEPLLLLFLTSVYILFACSLVMMTTLIERQCNYPYGKAKHESRVANREFRDTNHEFRFTNYESSFMSYEFKPLSYGFKSTSHEFKNTSYQFKSTSYEVKYMSHEHKSTS